MQGGNARQRRTATMQADKARLQSSEKATQQGKAIGKPTKPGDNAKQHRKATSQANKLRRQDLATQQANQARQQGTATMQGDNARRQGKATRQGNKKGNKARQQDKATMQGNDGERLPVRMANLLLWATRQLPARRQNEKHKLTARRPKGA